VICTFGGSALLFQMPICARGTENCTSHFRLLSCYQQSSPGFENMITKSQVIKKRQQKDIPFIMIINPPEQPYKNI